MAQSANVTVEAAVLGAAKQIEHAIDDEINALDSLDDTELEQIRKKRLAELKREAEQRKEWVTKGHGSLATITERDFFDQAKQSEKLVVVFGRPSSSRLGKDVEEWLGVVAKEHMECRFVALDAEKCPFLCNRFSIQVLPALLVAKDGKVVKVLHGLDEIDHKGNLSAEKFEAKLFELGVLSSTCISDESNSTKENMSNKNRLYVGGGASKIGSRRRV